MKRSTRDFGLAAVGIAILLYIAFGRGTGTVERADDPKLTVRLAHFPNMTHAPALVGVAKGLFAQSLAEVGLDVKVVNAGPEAMEALLAGQIDIAYVGPSPAINTFAKSKGEALRIISSACDGGASLICRNDVPISSVKDLDGKKVAVPQLGGTQDVSCRKFASENGLMTKDQGGTVEIIPAKNPDILTLFKQKQIDAAWVPEPWAARIKSETGAKTVVDERDLWPNRSFCTTVLVVRKAFADKHPVVVASFLKAHEKAILLINQQPDEVKALVNSQLKSLTGKSLKPEVLDEAWSHVSFKADLDKPSIEAFAKAAVEAGYSKGVPPNLDQIYQTEFR